MVCKRKWEELHYHNLQGFVVSVLPAIKIVFRNSVCDKNMILLHVNFCL